jgi:protein SCO1/2
MRTLRLLVVLLSAMLFAVGCDRSATESGGDMKFSPVNTEFKNTDVTGLDYAKDFALIDHNGIARTLADFRGKVVLVFFGYTHCPDVCPTTMAEMAGVMKELGKDADRVQVLFVTLDPARDTQALLAKYVPAFDPRFLGLRGDQAATEKTAKEFKIFFQKVDGKTADSYTIDHTAGSYVFDAKGRVRLFVRHGQGAAPIAHDLAILLKLG